MIRRIIAATALCLAGVYAGSVLAESQDVTDSTPSTSLLPVRGGGIHVLVDDMDGNGLADLAFTSHSGNYVQVHRQVAPRRFETAAEQTVAGFHPNDMIALPVSPKRYLINAEGDARLKIVAAQPDGGLSQIAEYSQRAPRAATPFNWPGWGISLAVTPYAGRMLTLLRDFDAGQAKAATVISLALGEVPTHVRVADLNADGVDELVLTAHKRNQIWLVEYPGPDKEPAPRLLWSFERGWPPHVIPLDVDRNGTLDLLIPMSVQQEIAVLLNDGKGNFTEGKAISYPGKTGIHMLTAGQDRDGARYLLTGGIRAMVLYRELKDSPGSFEHIMLPIGTWPNWMELKDIDGDGWLDAVAALQGGPSSPVIYGPLWETFSKLAAKAG